MRYITTLRTRLEKLFKYSVCSNPVDILKCIEKHDLEPQYTTKALRNFMNFLEEQDLIPFESLVLFRNRIKIRSNNGFDTFVPNTAQIARSGSLLQGKDLVLYKMILESGCRFTELKHLILNFNIKNIEEYGEIVVYRNFYLRGQKSSYYLFFTKKTFDELLKLNMTVQDLTKFTGHVRRGKEIIATKYLRKYQFTQLIKAGVDFEIANFIQGRCSKNVGFNHYLAKKEIAVGEFKKVI